MNLLWIELGSVRVLRCCIERLQVLPLLSSMAQEIEIFTFVWPPFLSVAAGVRLAGRDSTAYC